MGVVRVAKVNGGEMKGIERICAEVGLAWGVLVRWIRSEEEGGGWRDKVTVMEEELARVKQERDGLARKAEDEEGRVGEMEERYNRVNVKFGSLKKSLQRIEMEKDILKKENETMEKFVHSGVGGGRGGGEARFFMDRSAMGASVGDLAGSRTPGSRGVHRSILKSRDKESSRGGVTFDGGIANDDSFGDIETHISVLSPPRSLGRSSCEGGGVLNSSQKVIEEMRADNVLLSRALKQFLSESEGGGRGEGGDGGEASFFGGGFLDDEGENEA